MDHKGTGESFPSKMLKGPSGKAGGPFDVACKIGDGFSIVESGSKTAPSVNKLRCYGKKVQACDILLSNAE